IDPAPATNATFPVKSSTRFPHSTWTAPAIPFLDFAPRPVSAPGAPSRAHHRALTGQNGAGPAAKSLRSFSVHVYESALASSQKHAGRIADLAHTMVIAAFGSYFVRFQEQLRIDRHGLQIFNVQFRGHRVQSVEPAQFRHHLIQKSGNNSAV